MVHGGIAANRHVGDVGRAGADGKTKVMGERVDRGRRRLAQFRGALRPLDRVVHAADDIGAPGYLRVLDTEADQARAACQIDQETGDIGGAEIDGEAERAVSDRRKSDQLLITNVST